MVAHRSISRRSFLKFTGINLAALALPLPRVSSLPASLHWPRLTLEQLPTEIQTILRLVPKTAIDSSGYLMFHDTDRNYAFHAPLVRTAWNLEKCARVDRLYSHVPWGIVLHWYGDKEGFDRSIRGYLRGFDSLREVDDEIMITSAHFLVGGQAPNAYSRADGEQISILQTQIPDQDGTPFLASHLRPLNYPAPQERKQYFVRALYQMGYENPKVHSLLQDLFDGPVMDPNLRTIAIEITGYNFEKSDGFPSPRKIANTISLIVSLMKRYQIPISNLLGHHEIQLSKADPGKKFMALIRFLVAVKALTEEDEMMRRLVFGQYLDDRLDAKEAVRTYIKLVRDYLLMVSTPLTNYEWEATSKYWLVWEALHPDKAAILPSKQFYMPFQRTISTDGNYFLQPENHEGIDLYCEGIKSTIRQRSSVDTQLIANGVCEYIGISNHCQGGRSAIFRHRQDDGAEILSVYSHLTQAADLQVGKQYPAGYPIGAIDAPEKHINPYLHFSIAYGASWDAGLHLGPELPQNAGISWITRRYLDPLDYLTRAIDRPSSDTYPSTPIE